jgi:hypothetical protein
MREYRDTNQQAMAAFWSNFRRATKLDRADE